MFLFTTPGSTTREAAAPVPAAAGRAPAGVVEAIRDGARTSGVGFDYLLATAQRESALDPAAKAGTSSATGLFQFIEQTWLGTLKTAGPRLGLQAYADAVTARPDGTYAVADPATRQAILDLRRDPRISATLAGALTQKNREALSAALGREPTGGDLYAAHVLGAKGAVALAAAAQASPERAAALDLPEAAAANRGLFYDRSGRPRGAAELYAVLAAAPAAAAGAARGASDVTGLAQGEASLPQAASAYAAVDGGGLRALFQTDRRQGALSEGVSRLFQGRAAAPAREAPTYFPRSAQEPAPTEGATPAPEAGTDPGPYAAQAAIPAAGLALVNAPLPPRRPPELAAARAGIAAKPLDLSLFAIRSGP
ncbi:lytic transglycosylase domain-containing protein [Methylobacterium sp. A54F]